MRTVESGGEPGRLSSAAHHGALARMARMQGVANYGARFFSIASDAHHVAKHGIVHGIAGSRA
jgi:hypothetical protein